MFELDPETIGYLTFLAMILVVLWYFFSKENAHNNFLENKLKQLTDEERYNKTARQLKIEKDLENLNNPISYKKLINISYFIMAFMFIVFIALSFPLFGIFFAVISYKIPEIYISIMKDKKIRMFNEQLPDGINQLLAVLQSGQTPLQGFSLLAEAPYPMGKEFSKIYNDIKTGASMEVALKDLYERMPLNDIKLFMTGLIISQNATTSVAINTLKTILMTIKQRDSQKKSAKSAIASGKMTAIVLSVLPIFIFLGIESIMPKYMNDFLALPIGKIAIGIAFLLDGIGYLVARKITSASSIVKY